MERSEEQDKEGRAIMGRQKRLGHRPPENDNAEKIIADARKERERREQSYREQALRLFPPVCGRCGREFSGKKLRELTVHHKDHDHANNPPDGGNWELLCMYCHEDIHARYTVEGYQAPAPTDEESAQATHRPFEGLDALLKHKK